MKKTFLIRVDASSKIGLGHLSRMVALGQMLIDSGQNVHFATIPCGVDLVDLLKLEKFSIHLFPYPFFEYDDLSATISLSKKIGADWIILDGYQFSTLYEKKIKENAKTNKVLRVDDYTKFHHIADILLSQNYGSERMFFSTEPNTIRLLGLEFLLLRREFFQARDCEQLRQHDAEARLLVTLGGGTPQADDANLKIAEALSSIQDEKMAITFITGKMSRITNKIKEFLGSGHRCIGHSDDITTEMKGADFAITSGGSSMWELMFFEVPFLAVSLSETQNDYLKVLQNQKLCLYLGLFSELNSAGIRKALFQLKGDVQLQLEYKIRYRQLIDPNNLGKRLLELLIS
jgi:UDP-2,4-diacetamido-2,4,6-trideoxy-beta-L-altropyranose hydrolase